MASCSFMSCAEARLSVKSSERAIERAFGMPNLSTNNSFQRHGLWNRPENRHTARWRYARKQNTNVPVTLSTQRAKRLVGVLDPSAQGVRYEGEA
jgi:hypothetical protein